MFFLCSILLFIDSWISAILEYLQRQGLYHVLLYICKAYKAFLVCHSGFMRRSSVVNRKREI